MKSQALEDAGPTRSGSALRDDPGLPGLPKPVFDCDLVIPALDEEARIGDTISSLHEATTMASLHVRFIVVDNGCVDGTAEVVDALGRFEVPVELISCQTRGKGAAVRAGIRRSTSAFVGYCDADRSTPPSSVEHGLELLRSGWEVVVGSRKCAGAGYTKPQSTSRRIGSFAFHALATRITGPVSDTQCGFKLFTAPVARNLFEACTLNGFAFDVELLARARHANVRMIELPIMWSDSEGSTFRPVTDGIRSFGELRAAHRSLSDIYQRQPSEAHLTSARRSRREGAETKHEETSSHRLSTDSSTPPPSPYLGLACFRRAGGRRPVRPRQRRLADLFARRRADGRLERHQHDHNRRPDAHQAVVVPDRRAGRHQPHGDRRDGVFRILGRLRVRRQRLTGALQWKVYLGVTNTPSNCTPPADGISSPATVSNGVVYVGGGDGYFYALNAATGAVNWRVWVEGSNTPGTYDGHYNWSGPLIVNGYAYVGMASFGDCPLIQGQLLQISLTSGTIYNTLNLVPNGQVGGGIWTSPAYDPATNTIFTNTGTQNLPTQQWAQAYLAIDAGTLEVKNSWKLPASEAVEDSDFGTSTTLFSDANGDHARDVHQ